MRRAMRAALAVLAFLTLSTPLAPGPPPGPGSPGTARLFAEPVALNLGRPGERRLGPLIYRGGWALTSDDRRFGAISSMHVQGTEILAASDRGLVFRFALPKAGATEMSIMPLPRGPGGFSGKQDRDSEALAVAGNRLWIAFENSNSVWRYRADNLQPEAAATPSSMDSWAANRGAEAMVRLPDGRFLVIAEDEDEGGTSPAVLFMGDPAMAGTQTLKFSLRLPQDYRITDAAMLPNGRLLLLSRTVSLFGGWSAKLLTANMPGRAEETVQTWEVATLASPLTRDNMEALSITREGERTIVWLASDDNLNAVQRTLLMKFEVAE